MSGSWMRRVWRMRQDSEAAEVVCWHTPLLLVATPPVGATRSKCSFSRAVARAVTCGSLSERVSGPGCNGRGTLLPDLHCMSCCLHCMVLLPPHPTPTTRRYWWGRRCVYMWTACHRRPPQGQVGLQVTGPPCHPCKPVNLGRLAQGCSTRCTWSMPPQGAASEPVERSSTLTVGRTPPGTAAGTPPAPPQPQPQRTAGRKCTASRHRHRPAGPAASSQPALAVPRPCTQSVEPGDPQVAPGGRAAALRTPLPCTPKQKPSGAWARQVLLDTSPSCSLGRQAVPRPCSPLHSVRASLDPRMQAPPHPIPQMHPRPASRARLAQLQRKTERRRVGSRCDVGRVQVPKSTAWRQCVETLDTSHQPAVHGLPRRGHARTCAQPSSVLQNALPCITHGSHKTTAASRRRAA